VWLYIFVLEKIALILLGSQWCDCLFSGRQRSFMTDQDDLRQHGEVHRRKIKLAGTQKPCTSLCVLVAMYVYVCVREREREREMNSNYSQNRLEYLDFICTLFRQKIITFFSHVYLKINLQAAGNGQKEAVAPLVHTRMLNVKINDYGSYDPSPSMDKPHLKFIPN